MEKMMKELVCGWLLEKIVLMMLKFFYTVHDGISWEPSRNGVCFNVYRTRSSITNNSFMECAPGNYPCSCSCSCSRTNINCSC